jgi:hypothetical protein
MRILNAPMNREEEKKINEQISTQTTRFSAGFSFAAYKSTRTTRGAKERETDRQEKKATGKNLSVHSLPNGSS